MDKNSSTYIWGLIGVGLLGVLVGIYFGILLTTLLQL